MAELDTLALPVLPLHAGVVLSQTVTTLTLDSDEAKAAVAAALDADSRLLLVPRIDGRFATVGTVARVEEAGDLPNGVAAAILRGLHRARLGAGVAGTGSGLSVEAHEVIDDDPTPEVDELGRELRGVLGVLAERRRSRRLPELLRSTSDPGALADGFGAWSDLPSERKLELLETVDVRARVELALRLARDLLADHELQERIRHEVTDGMEQQQREFLLRQQLQAIRKELGDDDHGDGAESYRDRAAALTLPDDVRSAVDREIGRLERTGEQNPEQGWIRTWLDTILDLPWSVRSEERLAVAEARAVLDADHTGLTDVKDRIVEYLAVRKLRADRGFDDADGARGDAGQGAAHQGARAHRAGRSRFPSGFARRTASQCVGRGHRSPRKNGPRPAEACAPAAGCAAQGPWP
jgi:ATP-dependent Lon protease